VIEGQDAPALPFEAPAMTATRDRDTKRQFTLIDAIALVASAAIGLALVRGWESPNWCMEPMAFAFPNPTPSTPRQLVRAVSLAVSWTIPFAMTSTVAILILRMRRPRPSFRRIARQPGTVGCASALLAMAIRMGHEATTYLMGNLIRPSSPIRLPSPPFLRYDNIGYHPPLGQIMHNILLEWFPFLVSPSVGIAVIVSWSALRATGAWRPESSWIDRAGRLMGIYWIAVGAAIFVLMELHQFLM
jgi:hypothetical protein